MVKVNYDGVVEAVHYKPNGELDWVRAYLRRGAAFTDRILLTRQQLVEQLKAGKRFVLGERIQYLGGVFHVSEPIRLKMQDHNPVIVLDDRHATQDDLSGVPVI